MAHRITFLILLASCSVLHAETIRVPKDKPTIQGAVNIAAAGDTVLISPSRYKERLILKPEIILRSSRENPIRGFRSHVISVNDSIKLAHVFGNQAFSTDPNSEAVRIQGPEGIVSNNVLKVINCETD